MKRILLLLMVMISILTIHAQAPTKGGEWKDNTGRHINAHGGCIINYTLIPQHYYKLNFLST